MLRLHRLYIWLNCFRNEASKEIFVLSKVLWFATMWRIQHTVVSLQHKCWPFRLLRENTTVQDVCDKSITYVYRHVAAVGLYSDLSPDVNVQAYVRHTSCCDTSIWFMAILRCWIDFSAHAYCVSHLHMYSEWARSLCWTWINRKFM